MTYTELTLPQLRTLTEERGLGTLSWRASARKAELISALETGIVTSMTTPIEAAVGTLIETIRSKAVDESRVAEMISTAIAGLRPETIVIDRERTIETPMGRQHRSFPKLLSAIQARVPIWLHGPTGSGKSRAVQEAAKALNRPFYAISCSGDLSRTAFFGYQNATGTYVESLLFHAWTRGGILCLDEVDSSDENTLMALNEIASSTIAAFPCGMTERHPKFQIVATANTVGSGATRSYCGRNQIDSATTARFAFIEWPYDEDLERFLAGNDKWTDRVLAVRHAVDRLAGTIRHIVSPRASYDGAKLLAAGMPWGEVEESTIWKGLSTPERAKIESEARNGGAQ